jgi:hypothetical protein
MDLGRDLVAPGGGFPEAGGAPRRNQVHAALAQDRGVPRLPHDESVTIRA